MQLGHVNRYRRGVRLGWEELRVYLQSIPLALRSPRQLRAVTLLEYLTSSHRRQKLFFTERDGTTRAEPWRRWFEEGEESERTLAVLEQMDKEEMELRSAQQ